MSDQASRPIPKRLADFEILRRLGVGGMAEVFLAKKRGAEGTYKLLVVKRILPAHGSSRRFRAMFAEEAQLATRLNHPNIVQVYEFQDYGDEGQLLSMEYVEGPDLRKLQRSAAGAGRRIPPYVAAYLVSEVAKGLHYAHERKDERGVPLDIVHRDVSPQNILLSYEGAVKIADFGIASANLFREELGVLKGKTRYMSPEQARGERVDRRTDVYSLGVVFHELLTGRTLHGAAEGPELLEAVREGQVEAPSTFARDVPAELEEIAMRALAKRPDQRFESARELARVITRALFEKQQLVDAHALEAEIASIIAREHTSPGAAESIGAGDGSASLPEDSRGHDSARVTPPGSASDLEAWREDERTGAGRRWTSLRARAGREVRHVAVVTLRVHGIGALREAAGNDAAVRIVEQLRTLLDELAFKRGARWSWDVESPSDRATQLGASARAVLGLLENPARAANDAASLAVDVHEVLGGIAEEAPVKLQASVGIVRGIATGRRDRAGHLIRHTLRKPAEYLAQILGDRAPPSATWVAGGLFRLVRRDFVWEEVPQIAIDNPVARDLPSVMRIYSLVRPKTREEKVEELGLAPSDLVGRDAELADLQAAFHHCRRGGAARGQPGMVTARVVVGEMGIGKSALTNAFLAELKGEIRVLLAECSPASVELPYGAVAELLRELTGTRSNQSENQIRAALCDQLGEPEDSQIVSRFAEIVAGRMAPAADEGDAAHVRELISTGTRRLLGRATESGPLVVVVEGLQWSDRLSLALLAELVTNRAPIAVMFVLVTRSEERVHEYLEGLVRIELKGLSPESQIRLVQAHLGASSGVAQVCADLIPRAAGNPYFLLEMVDALLERGILELRGQEGGRQQLVRVERPGEAGAPLPSTLEQLIADRLTELPDEEHAIVEWVAVSGGPLAERDLRVLTGTDCDDVVARLCARGLFEKRHDLVDVRHPLTRDVAYAALDRSARVRKHRALGEHLATTRLAKGITAAMVARHLARGDARHEAAELYLEAAAAARASYQVQLANRYFRRALALLDESDPRCIEAHEALEASSRNQGRWRDRRSHLAALRRLARASEKPRWVAVALLRTGQLELDEGRLASALTSAQRAEEVARRTRLEVPAVEAQAFIAEILRDLGDMQGALAACDRALETASSEQVPKRLRAEVLRTRGTLLTRVGRATEAVDAYAEAIAVFRHVGARRYDARAKNSLAFALFVLGRYEDAIALALQAIKIDLAIGGRFQIARTLSTIGQSYARLGDLRRGLSYLTRAREAHERYGDQDSRAETLLCTAEVLIELGDLAAADNLVRDAGALTAVSGSAYDLVHEKILRAVLARASADPSSAVMHAFDARQGAEAQAYVAYHFYAMAVEAASRVDVGELHTGILLATTAMGAIETIQGSEYGLQTRAICCETLRKAQARQAEQMAQRAADFARGLVESIRDPVLRRLCRRMPLVIELLGPVSESDLGSPQALLARGPGTAEGD